MSTKYDITKTGAGGSAAIFWFLLMYGIGMMVTIIWMMP